MSAILAALPCPPPGHVRHVRHHGHSHLNPRPVKVRRAPAARSTHECFLLKDIVVMLGELPEPVGWAPPAVSPPPAVGAPPEPGREDYVWGRFYPPFTPTGVGRWYQPPRHNYCIEQPTTVWCQRPVQLPPPGVPEPGAWGLMLLGLGLVGATMRTVRRLARPRALCAKGGDGRSPSPLPLRLRPETGDWGGAERVDQPGGGGEMPQRLHTRGRHRSSLSTVDSRRGRVGQDPKCCLKL